LPAAAAYTPGDALRRGAVIERNKPLILVKGAGDVGSAVAHALFSAGYPIVLVEGEQPATARRGMSFAEAVFLGRAELEGVPALRCESPAAVRDELGRRRAIPLFVGSPDDLRRELRPEVMVDARLRKREQPVVQIDEAPLTIGLGPGFRAGETTHLVVETNWGPGLGAVLERGEAEAYTGQPRQVLGYGRERYSYAPAAGVWRTELEIGRPVRAGQVLGTVGRHELRASIDGVVRGITRDGVRVAVGAKVADVDPRGEQAVVEGIAERPRRIAAGVLEAVRRGTARRAE
jgi:xanthine dehydrogenase accessory factor